MKIKISSIQLKNEPDKTGYFCVRQNYVDFKEFSMFIDE